MNPPRPNDGPELHLLLEDFWKTRPVTPAGASPIIPIDGPPPRLLLSEYDRKLSEGAAAARADRNLPPDPSAPALQFLVADFDPARRRHQQPAHPSAVIPVDEPLDFEVQWQDQAAAGQRRRARFGSAAAHLALIALLLMQPFAERESDPTDPDSERDYTQITLLAPSKQTIERLTRGKEAEEQVFRGDPEPAQEALTRLTEPVPAAPAPEIDQPSTPQPLELEPTPDPEPPKPAAEEPKPTPTPTPPESTAPAPDDFRRGRQMARINDPRELPAPRAPKPKPKLVLEDPKATMPGRADDQVTLGNLGVNQRPDQVIEAAIQQMKQQGGGRQAIGEGVGASPNAGYLTPSPGNVGSGLELLSDPKGVDFRPYLTQVLNSVRRNWYAVIPESARLGMERGRVAIQFVIDRRGDVPKLVIASTAGSPPLDRASVAGVSASLPFPPLPAEFSGDQIKLQLVFLYNMRR